MYLTDVQWLEKKKPRYTLDKSHKQWIGIKNRSCVFRMKLNPDIPSAGGYFDNFDQTAIGINTRTQHSCLFELSAIRAAEFISMAMTFFYMRFPIRLKNF